MSLLRMTEAVWQFAYCAYVETAECIKIGPDGNVSVGKVHLVSGCILLEKNRSY